MNLLGIDIGDLSALAVAMDGLPVLARERAAAGQG